MKKPLIALALFALTLPLGCKVEDEPPDPLASRAGFCDAWAANACQGKVVENCNANSVEDCKSAQSDFCRGILPESYSSKHAEECLDAVKAAYKDASLSPDDIAVVVKLGAPCDQLSKGTVDEGESCETNDECNTAAGLICVIKLGSAKGTCATLEEVDGGMACDGDDQVCADGFYCDGENCIAHKKTGKPCDSGADYECTPEDHCVTATDATEGTCEPRLALNKPCASDAECASGYCAIPPGDTMGQCASTIVLSRLEPLCSNLR